jgi:cbb3-type cytochrome oxidase maturation protein
VSALVILIPVSLVLLGIAIWAFFWAVNKGQFDDLDTPPLRILEDDPPRAGGDPGTPAVNDDEREDEDPNKDDRRANPEPSPQRHARGERGSSPPVE